ncbi:MFS transporter [Sutcliffiella cohnii]|uniref:MFS transporter n=1 Tax=Sutcliffiella cohnii TaxID=33932 RepID=UPI002E1BA08B|nr:MFS transporter [Sutcliffiella cohnii]
MRLLYIVVIVAFIDTFSQLPIIAPFAVSVGATPLIVGIVIGMYSFSNIVGNIISGLLIDRIGAKVILWIGMVAVGIVLFFYSLVTTPTELLIVRFLHGLVGGLIVPAAFVLIRTMKKRDVKKGKAMAYSGAAVGVAAIIGPALGGVLTSKFGYDALFYLISTLMVVFGMFTLFFIKYEKVDSKLKTSKEGSNFKLVTPLIHSYLSIFLLLFTLGLLTYTLPLKVESLLLNSSTTGILLSVFGIVAILFFLLPTNKLYDQARKSVLMNIGLFLIALSLVALSLSNGILTLLLSMAVFGIGFAYIFPSTSATVMEYSGESRQGIAFGIFYSCFSLGVVTGSFVAGLLALQANELFRFGSITVVSIVFIFMFITSKKKKRALDN